MLPRRARLLPLAAAALVGPLSACGGKVPAPSGGRVSVVAAENFWGSIAGQLGGDRARVTSIITNPNADPHDYEPTAADGRALAGAQLAIVNGVGYDPWATKLLSADPASGRIVLTVGQLVGVPSGGNPHRWYSPPDVHRVIDQITADYERLDPAHATYFKERRARFLRRALAPYDRLISRIKRRYRGTPVGASESIFTPLARALGIRLLTPPGLLDAVSEGTEPTVKDKSTAERQIAAHQIRAWVFNSQNATPDVQRLNDSAGAAGIPEATVTETLTPASTTFEAWQSRQLRALLSALKGSAH